MPLSTLLNLWQSDPEIAKNVAAWKELPPRPGEYRPLPKALNPALKSALESAGLDRLFSHQTACWEAVQSGRNCAVVTGTASGKTLGYNLPVLDHLLRWPEARAIYLFPTKALAQDQQSGLDQINQRLPVVDRVPVATYDGDTPAHDRPRIRSHARILITNPDMLHLGILPHHTRWAALFRHLDFLVIDEMHAYRGVFGSHVANVVRRLKRVAAFYGSAPTFLMTSATIANPQELSEGLIEEPVRVIARDGSAQGSKHFLIYNPPITNPELGLRVPASAESVRLAGDLLAYGIQTIVFAGTRRMVELTLASLRNRNAGDASQVRGYRSGYLPPERRAIEAGLRAGTVRAVVATNALELGIDIGSMDAAVLAGYPGTIAATWQQAGRAGRRSDTSLAVLVAGANPLDQFIAHHPEYFFENSPERALINPDNLLILLDHIRCAAFELPFKASDTYGGLSAANLAEILDVLAGEGTVHRSNGSTHWVSDQYPAQQVSLRSASANRVLLIDRALQNGAATIGEVDRESATWMTHPGAIYLHEGRVFLVEDLDLESGEAGLKPVEVDYYTQPRTETALEIIEERDKTVNAACEYAHGELLVTRQVTGYSRILWENNQRMDLIELDMPPSQLLTTGFWLVIAGETVAGLREIGYWISDRIDYGPNWHAQRQRARARDGKICQNCGTPEGQQTHHVHHKTPFRTFASYLEANRLENLITLCPACHRKAEAVVRVRSGLAGLAYTLGHIAPLFLMCDRRDLGVHTDPESAIADGNPLIAIYDQVPAGIGFSQRLFELQAELLIQAQRLIRACACEDGCPACVGPTAISGSGGKQETLALLRAVLDPP